jgi:hypothetical protein
MRIFDLYISIKITFLFTLLPYYITENEDFNDLKNKRDINDLNKSAGDLTVKFTKVSFYMNNFRYY